MKTSLFVTLCLSLAACGGHKEEEAPRKPVVPVKTAVAEGVSVELTLRAPATIFPREQANITPRLTGVIRELKARKGDTVAAGALLVTLENRDLTSQREEAQAMLADAEANLEKMRRGTLPSDIERARGQVETTRALLNQAQKVFDRRKALFNQGAIPNRDLLLSETELSTAKTNFEVASRSLQLLEQQSQGQDIRIGEARVEQARGRLASVSAQLQYARLHAPFRGVITEQFQYAGDLGQPSAPIFTLVDLTVVSARAQVPESEAGRVKPAQACAFSGGENEAPSIAGRVSVINRAVDQQRRSVEVWCEIVRPPASLRAGAFGSVAFQTGRLQHTVLVPVTALQLEEGTRKGAVMMLDGRNIAHRKQVEVGDLVGDKRVVLSGLDAGVTVITEGAYELPDGARVETGKEQKAVTGGLAGFALRHGRALVLVALSFALAGMLLIPRIPISVFPQTDFPRIVILVDNGIAPPNIQMTTVTRPIEEAIRLVPGITTVRSTTARGSTEISVFFRWDVDILNALHLVQGRISQITPTLPPECRFYINRLTFSVFPMVGFSITSPSRKTSELWDLAYYEISPRLYRLPGVAETRIVGGRAPEYHVLVDPSRLNAFNMPLTKVVDAIRNSNTIVPAGMLQENYHLYLTTVTGLMEDPRQIENTVVDVVKGTPVLVKDIANVVPGEKPAYNIVTANGRPAVLINVLQQPDGNAVQVADAVNAELVEIRKTLPRDIELSTYYDQSVLVRDSISGVVESILIGLLLSVAVLLAFLKNLRMTIVAAAVIPVAVLTAVVCMKLFHMSFNLMTLGGIAACIGVVIDDAIVMVENIAVHLNMGQRPDDAARSAIVELTPALIGSTLTPIVVFVPLVFLGGITAVFFRALALTMVASLLASLVLALVFTPVLAAWLLKPSPGGGEGRWMRWLTARYESTLHWALAKPGFIAVLTVAILAGSAALYWQLGSGFLPEMDEGAFVLDYRTPAGTSLQETDRILRKIEKHLAETPEIESYSRRTGARLALAIAEPNTGDFLIKLKRDRSRSVEDVTSELREKITSSEAALPELQFPHILEDLIGDLAWAPQPIEIKITHKDEAVFKAVAEQVEKWLPKIDGVVDIVNQTIVIGPAINFRVDQEKASRAGFSVSDVANIEAAVLDGQLASTMIRGDRRIGIRVRYPAEMRKGVDQLQSLLLTSPSGVTVPLSNIAHVEMQEGQTEVRRENLRNLSAVTARLERRDLGSAMKEIQERLPKEIKLPPGTDIEYGGLYQIQQESFRSLTQVLLMSIVLIFIILVFEFRSFAHPFAIVLATVLCTFGSLAALMITGQTLNISSFMGIIMVIGIIHKNGILMLDSEQHFTGQGLELRDAVYQAGRRRLRPILMTAAATMFGMLPLALGAGSGAQLLQPLAIAVIGGVAVSMVLSLVITPVVFSMVRR